MNGFSVVVDPDGTDVVASRLAPLLRPGDTLVLRGGLAAGKTYFVQRLVRALGSESAVTSPTFAIAHFYPLPEGLFLHVDAYRLSGVAEYRDLGLDEYAADAVAAIEWGDRLEGEFPDPLRLEMETVPEGESLRRITLSGEGARWTPVLDQLRREVPGSPA